MSTTSIARTFRRNWFAGGVNILVALAIGYSVYRLVPTTDLEVTGILLSLVLLIFVPITFTRFVKQRTPEQVEELYLTLLTRREIFFSSWRGAAVFTLFCVILLCVTSLGLQVAFMWSRYRSWGMMYPLARVLAIIAATTGVMLVLSFLIILKALRVWMLLQNRCWLIVPAVLFIMIPDFLVLAALFVVAWVMDSRWWIAAGVLAITVWNYRIAMNWGIETLFQTIDPPSLRDLFFGRYHRLKQEEERDAA